MRKHFSRVCLASSDNYEVQHKAHKRYILEQHESNKTIIANITAEIVPTKRAYVRVFGELIPITLEEASKLTIEVIYL
jgi:hypothetical protein